MARRQTEAAEAPATVTPLARVAAPLRQELISQIKASILTFEYQPGSRLVERALCDRYGVSRTVVREALRHLEAEGLVTIVPNRGPVVTVLSAEDAAALYEVRSELEALAARLFADRASKDERKRLQSAVSHVASAVRSGDLQEILNSKDQFYEALFAGTHNSVMSDILISLLARMQLMRGLSLRASGRQPQMLDEIRVICKAAVAGDGDAAARATKSHVERAASVALAAMQQQAAGS